MAAVSVVMCEVWDHGVGGNDGHAFYVRQTDVLKAVAESVCSLN